MTTHLARRSVLSRTFVFGQQGLMAGLGIEGSKITRI